MFQENTPIEFYPFVKAINHTGYSVVAPENTIPAYKLSKMKGFRYVETDISFTSDGIPVLLHDSTIDRTSNGSGNVCDFTYHDLLKYDFGCWKSEDYAGTKIPTLEEFMLLCRNLGLHPYLELKNSMTADNVTKCANIVKKYGMMKNVTWISFYDTALEYLRANDPSARLGYLVEAISPAVIDNVLKLKNKMNAVFIDTYFETVTDPLVKLCIDANIPLEVWTVDAASDLLQLNPYISGVTSNCLRADEILCLHSIG